MKEQPFWRRYARLWGSDREADIRDELDFHLAMRAEEEAEKGAGDHALDAARRAFGDEARIAEELRRIGQRREVRERRVRAWQGMGQDLMQSLRTFRRAPAIPLLIACTLGLGIGGTTTVFTLFDAVVLRPVAVPDVERVFALSGVQQNGRAGLGVRPAPLPVRHCTARAGELRAGGAHLRHHRGSRNVGAAPAGARG